MSWWSFFKAVVHGQHKPAGTTWAMGIFTVLYTIMPVDIFPELFFPVIGYIDDIGFWGVFIALAAREKSRWEVANAPQTVHAERLA
jgi:uncharacterized membrane protein YkvA (DUF1232 family)